MNIRLPASREDGVPGLTVVAEATAREGVVNESDDGLDVHYKDKADEAHKARIGEIFTDEAWSKRTIAQFEFFKKKKVLAEIDKYLGKLKLSA